MVKISVRSRGIIQLQGSRLRNKTEIGREVAIYVLNLRKKAEKDGTSQSLSKRRENDRDVSAFKWNQLGVSREQRTRE